MPSRSQIVPLPRKKVPTADDFNILAWVFNGSFSNTRGSRTETTKRGLGIPVRFTGFDGIMATGLRDATSYALEVRNRESTAQRALMVRTSNNTAAFHVTGGKSYGPTNTGSSTTGQVLVNGSTAGGVLTGTYPDPGFYLSTEQYVLRPKMIMQWWGSNATVLVAGNLELQDAPGWVLCGGQTVTMRAGGSVAVPNMNDRYPIGAGGTYAIGATAGNTLAGQQSISIAHTHSHDHAHEHTVPNHTHTHGHTATGLTIPTHSHSGVGLTATAHTHGANHTHPGSHSHASQAHTHPGSHSHGSQAHTHPQSHSHGLDSHDHDLAGTASMGAPSATSNRADGPNSVGSATHTHSLTGPTGPGEVVGGASSFSGTQSDSNVGAASYSGSPSQDSNVFSASYSGSPAADTNAPASDHGATDSNTTTTVTGSTATDGGGGAVAGTTADALTSATTGTVATTNKTSSVDASAASVTTINTQPPTLALWFIMKL